MNVYLIISENTSRAVSLTATNKSFTYYHACFQLSSLIRHKYDCCWKQSHYGIVWMQGCWRWKSPHGHWARYHTGTPADDCSTSRKLRTLLLEPLRLHVFVKPSFSASTFKGLNNAINTQRYCRILPDQPIINNRKRPGRFTRDVIVLHDNSRAQVACILADITSLVCKV